LINGIERVNCVQPGFAGIALKLHGQQDIVFEFWNTAGRDEAITRLKELKVPEPATTPYRSSTPSHPAGILVPSKEALLQSRVLPDDFMSRLPFIANKPWTMRSVALSPRTFTLLTIGSRGDVQPYIALGLRLKKDGVSGQSIKLTSASPRRGYPCRIQRMDRGIRLGA
jgi:sterol 3beta-glucosyltransferase